MEWVCGRFAAAQAETLARPALAAVHALTSERPSREGPDSTIPSSFTSARKRLKRSKAICLNSISRPRNWQSTFTCAVGTGVRLGSQQLHQRSAAPCPHPSGSAGRPGSGPQSQPAQCCSWREGVSARERFDVEARVSHRIFSSFCSCRAAAIFFFASFAFWPCS